MAEPARVPPQPRSAPPTIAPITPTDATSLPVRNNAANGSARTQASRAIALGRGLDAVDCPRTRARKVLRRERRREFGIRDIWRQRRHVPKKLRFQSLRQSILDPLVLVAASHPPAVAIRRERLVRHKRHHLTGMQLLGPRIVVRVLERRKAAVQHLESACRIAGRRCSTSSRPVTTSRRTTGSPRQSRQRFECRL